MEISNLLLEERYVVKPFYCCFNDKEYILQGSEDGLIFEEKSIKNIGSIIIELSEKSQRPF